jgi:hypothetical protein
VHHILEEEAEKIGCVPSFDGCEVIF